MASELIGQKEAEAPRTKISEIYVRGKWVAAPALVVDDKSIVVRGKWLKTAVIRSEEWLETEVQDPERCIRLLRMQGSPVGRADIFTFTQMPTPNDS